MKPSVLAGREDAAVATYRAGTSIRQTASLFGVSGQTVKRLLTARGVAVHAGHPAGEKIPPPAADPKTPEVDALTSTELAYIAGLIDGEGCLLIYEKKDARGNRTHRCILRISNTSRRVIHWLQERLGGISVVGSKPKASNLDVFHWAYEGPRLSALLAAVTPYLVIKTELADLVAEMQRTMLYGSSGKRLPAGVHEERAEIFRRYRAERVTMKGR